MAGRMGGNWATWRILYSLDSYCSCGCLDCTGSSLMATSSALVMFVPGAGGRRGAGEGRREGRVGGLVGCLWTMGRVCLLVLAAVCTVPPLWPAATARRSTHTPTPQMAMIAVTRRRGRRSPARIPGAPPGAAGTSPKFGRRNDAVGGVRCARAWRRAALPG